MLFYSIHKNCFSGIYDWYVDVEQRGQRVRIAIYSDVHGNLEALDAVLEALSNESVDRTICLGDLVGYGPNPNECIEKVMESADVVVAGNHDYAAVNLVSTDHFNEYARVAIDWTKKVLSPNSVNILNGLPLIQCDESYTVVHATPEAPDQWHY